MLKYNMKPNFSFFFSFKQNQYYKVCNIGLHQVEACTATMGVCGPPGDCDTRCSAEHKDGSGVCDLGFCFCIYPCPSTP